MNPDTTDIFNLSNPAKTAPRLIGPDRDHFLATQACLERRIANLKSQLDELRRLPGGKGREATERDSQIRHATTQLRVLERFGLDICLGRMIFADDPAHPVFIGRIGLTDDDDDQLLIDWRTPAAEPFFAATGAEPMGLASRRRYRWQDGRIRDYWDEVFTPEGLEDNAALDDQSAFIASLGAARSPRMRDVLSTIQSDQDAIIRASSKGPLVVEGGPGTGKTIVALHRAAYLLYSDPRLDGRQGQVLVVGPHRPYLNYIADVLPSLGEDGVTTCTLRDFVPEGATATQESDPKVAWLKSSKRVVEMVERAVAFYEEVPAKALTVETQWNELEVDASDWQEAFDARDPALPHNEARDDIWFALLDILMDKNEDDIPTDLLYQSLITNDDLRREFGRAWPILEPGDLVGDLWSVPAFLRHCAPWLRRDEIARLQRADTHAWTIADLPLLDAARRLLGDPHASRQAEERRRTLAEQRAYMDEVVDYILDTDDNPDSTLQMLRGDDLRTSLLDEGAISMPGRDALEGPFAHVIVDEAQDLTDAQWQMLLARCPSRSFTIVGDRAQSRAGFGESWEDRLNALGMHDVRTAKLTVNYRTPIEIMDEAEALIRTVLPHADVPTSVRSSGVPVQHGNVSELDAILDRWLTSHPEGTACVIDMADQADTASLATDLHETERESQLSSTESIYRQNGRVQWLTAETAKGLEFDLVVLVEPDEFVDPREFATDIAHVVDRYVAMTRATQELVVLSEAGS